MSVSLVFGGLLASLLTVEAALFDKFIPSQLNSAQLGPCAAKTIKTVSEVSAGDCAVACGLDSSCRAFLHIKQNGSCSLLTSQWMPLPSEDHTLMMRRQDEPWRFGGSEYVVLEEKGNFNTMKGKCADQGMHLWYPSSNEEMRSVEREILCNVPEKFFDKPWSSPTVVYLLWFGVIDNSDGSCKLADGVTSCPVTNWRPPEPSLAHSTCVGYWFRDGNFSWDDMGCHYSRYALCEKEIV